MVATELRRIPGREGLPVVGQTPKLLRDAEGWALESLDRYGPIFRTNVMFRRTIVFGTADAAKEILMDRDKRFSSEQGWDPYIGRLFSRGLMLLDFDEHRFHRSVMQAAFRSDALAGYVAMLRPIIERTIDELPIDREVDLYAVFKRLTLDISSEVFVGASLGVEADVLNEAFIDAVAAAVAPIRAPLPFTALRRGLKGWRLLEDWFASRVDSRRRSAASDLFTRLCTATGDDGETLSDRAVVDHMIFLLMAAHDTTTSSLASMAWYLTRDDDLQDSIADEAASNGGVFEFEHRKDYPLIDAAFKEAMRLHPAVPFIPRRTVAPGPVSGLDLPVATQLVVSALLVHRDPSIWTDPQVFDPHRFLPGRDEHRQHSHAYFPFSGGAHTCIGMHFAGLMATAITAALLARYRITTRPGLDVRIQTMPIPKPRGGLPVLLRPR